MKRAAAVTLLTAALLAAGSPRALADPPGPTDYRTSIVGFDPPVDGIRAEIVGGDSFVVLTVDPGLTVDVVGYQGEPYLRFGADGTVERNERSPTSYLNEDRYADVDIPPDADPAAVPEWATVARDGSYAWHDHRTHWMNDARPPGRSPGDVILEGVVPLVVDGSEVDLSVESIWEESPSPLPVAAGILLGAAAAFLAVRARRTAVGVAGAAALGTALGGWAYLSVPAETEPSSTMWLIPLTAFGLAILAVIVERRGTPSVARVATIAAAGELAAWAVTRWDWLWRAVIPTDLPFWLDRLGTAAALSGAIVVIAALLATWSRPGPARA